MSYCRWSSDFGECDVYVYESCCGGWDTHVAGRRLKHRVPDEIRSMPTTNGEEWLAQHQAVNEWRNSLPCDEYPCTYSRPDGTKYRGTSKSPKDSEYIELSEISVFAGESFNDPTPGDCADRLEEIRASGLNVPQYAIDALREEANA
jgi:hypothetical protein